MEINLKAKLSAYTLTSLKLAMQSKTNDGTAVEVYGYEGDEQKSISLSQTPSAGKIAQYSSTGILKSNEPVNDLDVVNKVFADTHYLNLQEGTTDEEMLDLLVLDNENKYVKYSGDGITYRAVLHTTPLVDPSTNQISSTDTNFYFNSEVDMAALSDAVFDLGGTVYGMFGSESLSAVVKLGFYGENFYIALLGRTGTDYSFTPIYAVSAMEYVEEGVRVHFNGGWQITSDYLQMLWGETPIFGLPTVDEIYINLFNSLITIAPRYYTDEPFPSEYEVNKIYLVKRDGSDLAYDANWYISGNEVINNVTSTHTKQPLSALQGKLLKDNFDSFKLWVEDILDSEEGDLDELHEIIELVKENTDAIGLESQRAIASENALDSSKLNKKTNSNDATEAYIFTNDSQDSIALDSASTADTVIVRDSSGRAQIANPSVDADIANKFYVDSSADTLQTNINTEATTREDADTSLDDKLDKALVTDTTISYDGDTVNLNKSFVNLKSQAETSIVENISLANYTTAGLMSPSDVTAIVELQEKVGQLQGQVVRLSYTASQTPTASDIALFVEEQGYTTNLASVAVVVAGTYHIWHYYENSTPQWQDAGVDTSTIFTNSSPGTILGASTDGKVYAETDGTGSVYGWSGLKTRVSNAETTIGEHTTAISNNGTAIAAKASVTTYSAVIGTTWSGSTAPYTQTVIVNGILATDTPIVDLVTSSNWGTLNDEEYAWCAIKSIDTINNGLVIYSDKALATALNIQIKVIK